MVSKEVTTHVMDDAHKQAIDKFWKDDQAFQTYLETVPEEWKGEADHMYQEGLALPAIQDRIASYQEPTEYPLRLTCWELGSIADLLQYQPDISPRERALLDKVYRLGDEIGRLRKGGQGAAA